MKRLICRLFHSHKDRMLTFRSVSRCRKCLTDWPVAWR